MATASVGCRKDTPAPTGEAPERAAPYDWKALVEAWRYPDPIPNFQLTDQDGKTFWLADFTDRYVVISFVFSRCPNAKACPLTMKKMREIQTRWARADKPAGARLQLIAVTLDPDFDTPEVLRAYGSSHEADFSTWKMATGPPELVNTDLPSLFGVLAMPVASEEERIRHSIRLAVLKPGLAHLTDWRNNGFEASDVVAAILKDARGSSAR